MAIIDTLRFRNILVDGDIAEEAPAQQFVTALDDTFEEQLEGVATKDFVRAESAELQAELRAMREQILRALAQAETRMQRQMLIATGVILTGFGIAVGLITGLT